METTKNNTSSRSISPQIQARMILTNLPLSFQPIENIVSLILFERKKKWPERKRTERIETEQNRRKKKEGDKKSQR